MKSVSCKISPQDLVVRKTIRNFPLLHHIVNCLTLLWSVIRITQYRVSSSIKNPWTKVHVSQSNKKPIKKESYYAIAPAKRSSFHKGETKSAQNILNMRDSTFLSTTVLHLLPTQPPSGRLSQSSSARMPLPSSLLRKKGANSSSKILTVRAHLRPGEEP